MVNREIKVHYADIDYSGNWDEWIKIAEYQKAKDTILFSERDPR